MKQLVEIPIRLAVLACDARIVAIWGVAAGEAAAIMSSDGGSVVSWIGRSIVGDAVGVPRFAVPLCIPFIPTLFVPFVTAIMSIAAAIVISRLSEIVVRFVPVFDGVIFPPVMGQL